MSINVPDNLSANLDPASDFLESFVVCPYCDNEVDIDTDEQRHEFETNGWVVCGECKK